MSVHSLPDKNTNEKNKLTLNITPSYVVPLRSYIVAKQQTYSFANNFPFGEISLAEK